MTTAFDTPALAPRQAESPQQRLALQLGLSTLSDVSQCEPSGLFVEKVPIAFARQHMVLGLKSDDGKMPIAVADLQNMGCLDSLGRFLGTAVRPALVVTPQGTVETAQQAILSAVNLAYQQRSGQAASFIESLDRGSVLEELQHLGSREDLLDSGHRAPIVKLVNLVLFEAVQQQASDVHVQPYEDRVVVRFRIDGVLEDRFRLPRHLHDEVVSRIKIMGRMNIAEKRLAQDGRATVTLGDRTVDLRLASLPTSFGERVVIRLLDKSARLFTLGELGMPADLQAGFRRLISSDHGIVLVTGPTGSGKTTTLYASLLEINSQELNILTLEDPIEYQLPGVSQTQVSDKKGMTFASGLRSVLRQDPDIIMVGEIRDHETAAMAVQSALTGHLVFSTLHTNDAASAVTRLLDLGIESYLVASSVVGVLAQRLVRRVCEKCAQRYLPTPQEVARLGAGSRGLRQGVGCEACRQAGYRGRTGLFELLIVDDDIRRLVQQRATAAELKAEAVARGMASLHDAGLACVRHGTTTLTELQRVVLDP